MRFLTTNGCLVTCPSEKWGIRIRSAGSGVFVVEGRHVDLADRFFRYEITKDEAEKLRQQSQVDQEDLPTNQGRARYAD